MATGLISGEAPRDIASIWADVIDHNISRLHGSLSGRKGCGIEDCARCATEDRHHERIARHRKGVEKVLREKLGERMFNSLREKGYINFYGYY